MAKLNPSKLDGSYSSRVFVGGSYARASRSILNGIARAVSDSGYHPIIADLYEMPNDLIHDITMSLLHSCQFAIFEGSTLSGAIMEMERIRDYGTFALIVYHDPGGTGWRVSRMLTSLLVERPPYCQTAPYIKASKITSIVRNWLDAFRRRKGQLHA